MNKRLVSIICAAALFTQTLPTNAIATTIEDAFIKKGLNSEVDKDKSDSNSEESSSKDENETSQDNKLKEEELGLDKVKFNAYIDKTDQLLFSIGFDEKEKKFTVSEQSEKNISEETPEETMYTIKIFDKEQKEKFSVELKGKDTGNSEKLEPLKSLNYEVGDFIQITPTDSKDVLKITGNIQGDVDKQKEDYSDGIDNYDYIGNVRFQVEEDHLKTVYNEAPVINGLTDIEESENPMNDILTGISIKDDHDGEIDNSKIVPLITELEGGVLEVSYTVEDSWGRKATGKRKISPKKVEQEEVKQEEPKIIREEIKLRTGSSSTSQNTNGLADNVITVEGTPYYGSQIARFEIRFDTIANQIQIANEDGRKLSNSVDGEYFKFVLYDKDMNVKTSATLLGSDKSDSDKLDAINNYLFEEGDYIGIWHAETKNGTSEQSNPENDPSSPSFIPKLKIGGIINVLTNNGSGNLTESQERRDYSNGMDNQDISSRRFRVTKNGLKEVTNQAPQIQSLNDVTIARGGEFDPLKDIKANKITDDFDKFTDDNLDARVVSISHSNFNNSKVGTQTITYTVTDSWGKSSTAQMNLIVTSRNPIDEKYIELKDGDKSLFKIKFDSVEHKFLVDNLENIVDKPIDSSVSSSIFKLKVYTKDGVLQKTLNIKGTDNLKSVLKKFDGYEYTVGDRIEVWSNNPKNIIIHGVDRDENKVPEQNPSEIPTEPSDGNTEQQPDGEASETPENGREDQVLESTTRAGNTNQAESYQENYEDGIDDSDYMKNVRFEIQSTKLKYIYNKAPEFIIQDNIKLEINRSGVLSKDDLMNGLTVDDDHDGGNLTKKVIVGELDTSTIGEKEVEYRVIDSWGRSSLIKRKVTVYPYNNLEYNYINVKNNETGESILKIRFDDINKKFVVDKVDKSKIPSSLNNDNKVFEIKLIKKEDINSRSNEDNVKVKTISLTKKELIDGDKVSEINNLSYKEFNYISLWVYDSKEGISISKKPNLTSNDQLLKSGVSEEGSLDGILLNGFENQEKMQNTRFEIKSEGLKKIYNEGPVINGLDDILYVYKNDNIEKSYALKGVSISSGIDNIIPNEKIVITNLNNENLENLGDEINKVGKFTLKYTVTDSWGKSATYNRTVSVISKSVSNDIEFYNKGGSENLFSLKYNPITNTFDVSKKENNQPSQGNQNESEETTEHQPQGQESSAQNKSSQEADNSNGEKLQTKTGDVENRNDTVQTTPSDNGEEGSSSGGSSTDQVENHPEQDPPTQNSSNSQGGQQSGGTGENDDQQAKGEIVFKLTVFNVKEQEVGKIELTEEEASNIDNIKERLKNITIYDDYYVAVWSNTPKRIKIKGKVKDNDKLGEKENKSVDYSQGTEEKDYINNVRFCLTVDGVKAIYNKAPEIIVTSKEMLTSYAGDIIDYTKNIKVVDDRDNPTGDHIIDNSKIKVTIVPKETNSGGTQTDSNGSASGSGSSNTEGNGDSDGTDSNPGSESGDTSSSEDIENQGQTTENEEAAFVNDESSSENGDKNENGTSSDKDNSNKTEEEKFLEEQKNNLKIGKNKIKLTVADSWGRTTTIERNLLILNGIDKNEIIFKAGSGKEPIRIKFNHDTKNLNITTQNEKFGNESNPGYVKIAVYRPNKNGVGATPIFEQISIDALNRVTDDTLQDLKNYEFEYGDYFEIYHGHPQLFSITGGVNDQREDYTDGVQNPENLLNVKFVITESGLKSIYTNPDENKISDNKVVFGPVAQEKFPFKIQIDFENQKFKVVETTGTELKYGDRKVVYKIALIRKESNGSTIIVRQNEFQGNDFGKNIMDTNSEDKNYNRKNKNWNGQSFEYNDCLYLWHDEPNRSIIKGNIKNKREDYTNGVDDPDNMNNVVFRLTPNGLESIYNNAPEIKGANNIDVYQNESFNVSEGIKYNDDYDADHLTKSVSLKENGMIRTVANTNNNNNGLNWNLDTSKLGEKILIYTATDRWGKTTTVERKVTVRPNLYKNVFKVYAESDNTIDDTSSKGISENLADGDSIGEISTPETTPLPNIPQQPSTDDSISNGNNAEDNKPEVDKRKLAFEIGFDTVNNKYKVYNQTNEKLSNNNTDETAFAIQIKSSTGQEKAKIILTGNKRGTAPELLELNNVKYADDDIIRIYRSTLSGIEITGDVTGDIPRENDDMNETNKFDYMKNTGFKVRNAGLNAKYNKAPVINGIKNDRTVSKGTVNLLEGINVSDDIDNISTNNIYIYIDDKLIGNVDNNNNSQLYTNYNFDEVGTYNIEYKLYDSWNRETIERSTVKVESKVRENEIEVYGPNQQLAFRITFDTNENKFILKGQDNSQNVSKENENIESYSSELNEDNYFQMIVRDARGNEKKKVILTGEVAHDSQQLSELHQFEFNKYDTISLKAKTAQAVKIKGNILPEVSAKSTITDYSNGFDTVEKYSEVRFKITDDGLREMTKKSLRINGADPIAIKRGDTLDLLDGISVGLDDENNDDYKITVKEISSNGNNVVLLDDTDSDDSTDKDEKLFKKLKEGVYTVRYTVTNSWGATTIANRQITVQPRTELEAVKLTVKDYQGDNILIIGFDSIEKKLRVIEYKKKSINYLDNSQVFEINAFDSLGKTIGTIALKGDQTINEEIINRINAFSYEEGYSLSVWSKELENRINIEGTIKVDNNSTEESKKSIYKTSLSLDDKKDKMENGRFEILSDGLKYIYNNAPTITGGGNAIPYYKGSLLSIPSDLTVEDDHDNISSSEVTIDDDQVDYDKLGLQDIKYVVEDSWGRRGTKPGKIEIRSSMDSNSINIYPKESSISNGNGSQEPITPGEGAEQEAPETKNGNIQNDSDNINQGNDNSGTNSGQGNESNGNNDGDNGIVKNSGFSIKFVREGDKNRIKVELGTKKNEKFDSNNSEQTFLTIKIYDVDGTVLKSIDILGSDTGTTAKGKIEAALKNINKDNIENPDQEDADDEGSQGGSNLNNNEFEYFNGQYIAIEGVTEATKSSVKIQGTVVNKQTEYNTGVSDLDKIENVRFKFSDLGLEAVYNNAPVIKIDDNIKLDGTERKNTSNVDEDSSQRTGTSNEEDVDGTKGDIFNYLRGVTLSDDHDILTKENVEVKWNEKFIGDSSNYETIEKNAVLESTEQEPTSIENGIKVYGQQQVGENTLYYKVTDSWGRVTFAQRKNIMLKNGIVQNVVRFNTDGKIIMKFEKVESNEQGTGKIKIKFEVSDFNRLTDATPDKYYQIKVTKPNEEQITVTLDGNFNRARVCQALSTINEKEFPYGTKIEIYAGHPQIFSIDGPVRNAAEDYSDKVQNPENLINTKFEITDAGLKATYIPPESDKITANENLISLVAPEKIPLKIKISPRTNNTRTSDDGTISIVDRNGTQIDYGVASVVFTMILRGKNGEVKRTININGNVNGNAESIRQQFDNFNYQYGDTLTISHTTPKKVIIKGNIKGNREDYSDGVDNSLNLTEAVFKLTATGMEVTYKSAPKIMGILDKEVIKGGEIDYEELKSSVSAKDNIDGIITDSIEFGDENIDTNEIGMHEFTYTVTNSNHRTTTKSSTITVYDLPEIEKNDKATIELNSIDDSEEAIEDYLKTAVDVSDDDDKLYGKETKLELISNDVKPSKEGVYKARYKATDLYGHSKEETINIQVVRTINVTVPTKLPFQVVTNLMPDENGNIENNGFVSGVLKLKNNNTSPVKVSVASFGKKAGSGELEIVNPDDYNWNELSYEDSMKKMALGLYIKDNSLTESEYNTENPLWLSTNKQNSDTANPDSSGESQEPSSRIGANEDSNGDKVNEINTKIGILRAKKTGSDTPAEASIGFTSKHGKNFIGGSVTGKFELIFKFE
ncbi:hypothetical protein [uncultured Clostridium sp.]|uniref:hypothetical protein n=1 Tax=uncultured Clostridium sp. TaxID=59620 RepID=UPI00265CDDBE|nr:hypothetical protein [uncultured Clostridium sp.]